MIFTHYSIICYIWGLLSLILLRVVDRIDFAPDRWLTNGALLFGLGIVLSLAHVLITTFGLEAFYRLIGSADVHRVVSWPMRFLRSLPSNMAIYLVILSVVVAVKANRKSHERAVHSAQLEGQLKTAQLAALSNQLQPHFLFNTLNTIASLTREDPDTAEEMIIRLCVLLRASLDTEKCQEVALVDELEILEKYVAIQQVRFGDRISVQTDVKETCLNAAVPTLVLQPLVENAIEHGFREQRFIAKVVITARQAGEQLLISVSDNGSGWSEATSDGQGTGMANTAARLERLYGDRQQFTYGNRRGGGFTVELELPYRELPASPAAEVVA